MSKHTYKLLECRSFFCDDGMKVTERIYSNGLVTRSLDYSQADWYLSLIDLKTNNNEIK